jgi:ankyrin repeat protein
MRRIFSVCLTSLLAFRVSAAAADEVDNLSAAAGRGDIIAVQSILAKGSDVNGKDKNGDTALMDACRGQASTVHEWQALDVTEALLAQGAEVNAKSTTGETALMLGYR